MTHPNPEAVIALENRVERYLEPGVGYGPGRRFYWFLAHHVAAEDIVFADLHIDRDRTFANERFGDVFMVTERAFIVAKYEHAAEDDEHVLDQDFGRAEVDFFPRSPAMHPSLRWQGRSLRINKARYGERVGTNRGEAHELTLTGQDWSVQLPRRTVADIDGYVSALLRALNLNR